MKRNVTWPKNPDALGRLITALRVYSGQRQPKNETERKINEALKAQEISPAVARRLIANLDKVPQNIRNRLLGEIAAPDFSPPAEAPRPPVPSTLAITVPLWVFSFPVVYPGPNQPDPDPVVPAYTIRYRGLYCQEETSWDQGSTDDEIYVITTAVSIDVDGNNVVRTVRHPVAESAAWYDNVDTAEERIGPVAAVWQGNSDPVSLTVAVFEHDQGDPEIYAKDIDDLVKAAISIGTYFFTGMALLAFVHQAIADAINWVLDTGDDLIEVQVVVNPRAILDSYAAEGAVQYYGWKVRWTWTGQTPTGTLVQVPTNLVCSFTTTHSGDGAVYVIGFDVLRDPPLPPLEIF